MLRTRGWWVTKRKSAHLIVGICVFGLSFGSVEARRSADLGYEADPSFKGVTVKGRVIYAGIVPRSERLLVHRDRSYCGDTIPNESLLVDPANRGIASVLVTLEGVTRGKPFPENRVQAVENRTCRFFPRTIGATLGTLEIQNADPVMHNTHIRKGSRFGDNLINIVQPPKSPAIQKPLAKPGMFDVRCDAHPFMHASIIVLEHPYFTVTDVTGQFELLDVPPGQFRLRIWHERLGMHERSLSVPDESGSMVTIEVGPEA